MRNFILFFFWVFSLSSCTIPSWDISSWCNEEIIFTLWTSSKLIKCWSNYYRTDIYSSMPVYQYYKKTDIQGDIKILNKDEHLFINWSKLFKYNQELNSSEIDTSTLEYIHSYLYKDKDNYYVYINDLSWIRFTKVSDNLVAKIDQLSNINSFLFSDWESLYFKWELVEGSKANSYREEKYKHSELWKDQILYTDWVYVYGNDRSWQFESPMKYELYKEKWYFVN